MNGINMGMGSGMVKSNGSNGSNGSEGFLGGMDLSTISALVVLASAFMRR